VTTFARISYEHGSNPLTVGTIRAFFGVALCLTLILIQSNRFSIQKREVIGASVIGLLAAGNTLGYLGAINYIPVSLSAILFFTWPLILLIYYSIRNPKLASITTIISFVFAFIGLFLIIGPVFQNLQTIGVLLALMAACCAAGVFVASQHYFTAVNLVVAAFWVNVITFIVLCLITISKDEFQLPTTTLGMSRLILASSSYAAGLVVMFLAIKSIGATSSALYFNLEPVVATLAATILLGESFKPIQIFGFTIVMVILLHTSMRQSKLSE